MDGNPFNFFGGGHDHGKGDPSRHSPSAEERLSSLFSTAQLRPHVRWHLARVYGTLALMMSCSLLAFFVHLNHIFGISGGGWAVLATFGCLLGILAVPHSETTIVYRRLLAVLFAFFKGLSVGPLFGYLTVFHNEIILNAAVSTLIVFLSFSALALLTSRSTSIVLGGYLMSALGVLFWLTLASSLFGSTLIHSVQIYLSLLVFSGFVTYDTQGIIFQANAVPSENSNQLDVIQPAINLYINAFSIFMDLLSLFLKEKRDSGDSNSKRRRRTRIR